MHMVSLNFPNHPDLFDDNFVFLQDLFALPTVLMAFLMVVCNFVSWQLCMLECIWSVLISLTTRIYLTIKG